MDGRSAKELAKAWFPVRGEPQVPPELTHLLESNEEAGNVVFRKGQPERVTVFDDCGGEGRNADLVLWGRTARGVALAGIEAKADESFGQVAGDYVARSLARNPRSRVPERFTLLCQGILGTAPDESARALRYQLLTAVAGAMVEAKACGAETTLFLVHEFVGRTDDGKLRANADDLNRFVRSLSGGRTRSAPPGMLVGPFEIPGNEHFAGTKRLFVGKCRRRV